jgi:hypothetical protein
MDQPGSSHFSRSIRFTRTTKRDGIFSIPTTTFTLQRAEDGQDIGTLTIKGNQAHYTTTNGLPEDFHIRKSHWSSKWMTEGIDKQEAARYGFGWNLRPFFKFRGDERYFMRIKRHWPFKKPEPGTPTLTVSFTREQTPVMELQSHAPFPLFRNETTVPLEGIITTNIPENQIVAGLLLFYQTHIQVRNKSAHA